MASDQERLQVLAARFAAIASDRVEAPRAQRLADRLNTGRFLVSVVGEFKRGKSTLINALIGAELLPTGVLPLTAVATEVSYGESLACVEFLNGQRQLIDPSALADYVTEDRNPNNERQVARVEVQGPWALLEPGVVIVDTPGVGSIHLHNTEAARAALLDADGAVLVMSADAPLSEQERDLVRTLAERRAPTFFVLNKADHLAPIELDQVRRFVEGIISDELGHKAPVFVVSARNALEVRLAGLPLGDASGDFQLFLSEVERFIAQDLVSARLRTARRELSRLGASVRDAVTIERAVAELDEAALAQLVELFRVEAGAQRQAFENDRTLLARDVARLEEDLWQRVSSFAAAAPAEHTSALEELAATAPRARLVEDLREGIASAVRTSFEQFRQAETWRTEQAWEQLATNFRSRTQQRVNTVREAASELFAVPLPAVAIPRVDKEREQFFYLFLHVGSFNEPFGRVVSRLLPEGVVRPRALRRARAELAREFDKHAGRARWDLTQRLDEARRRFEVAMRSELDEAIDGILGAATRAEQLHSRALEKQGALRVDTELQMSAAAELAALDEEIE